MTENNTLWNNSKMIYTDYELYYNPDEVPWGRDNGFIQHEDFPILDGMPVFVKDFTVSNPSAAKLIFTSLGCVDIWINGKRVGNDEMKPGWSDYGKRTLYYEYDVKDYMSDGNNRILAVLSNGWYSGRISGGMYGSNSPAVMMCLDIAEDNGKFTVVTDDTWKVDVCGQILNADIWDGEYRDATKDSYEKMSCCEYDVSAWNSAKICDYFDGEVTKFIGPTVRTREELSPKAESIIVYNSVKDDGTDFGEIIVDRKISEKSFELKKDEKAIIDVGQEIVGWLKVKVSGNRGAKLKIRYSEMLNDSGERSRGNDGPKGSVYTINYRTAKAKAYYVLGGDGIETYRPTFTFMGFRYIELSADDDIKIEEIIPEVVGSATKENGHIETSDKMVNKLISNIIWGQRSNYLSVPTDCPQRDERLGWTGDAQAFSVTAAYNADVLEFFRKWLQDMRDSQGEEGAYSDVVPRVKYASSDNASAWGDAGIIIPFNMYKIYGDTSIVEEHYTSMEKYIDQLIKNYGMTGPIPRYGDWLAYDFCKNEYISSAFLVHDIDLMIEMSKAIGKNERVIYYTDLRKQAHDYFVETFMENGELIGHTQTDYVLAIAFDLIDDEYKKKAADELAEKIKENGNRLSTGFVGTYNLCNVLSKMNKDNLAYTLLMQRKEPSWLYSIDQGATTVWERWNSYTIENGFGDVGMNSFNHYAYGSIEEWMYRYMAGIEADDAGFERILLQPRVDTRSDDELPDGQKRMTWIKASYNSVAGRIESNWSVEDGFLYECTVPDVPVTLMLPVLGTSLKINGKNHSFDEYEKNGDYVIVKLTGGHYIFEEK